MKVAQRAMDTMQEKDGQVGNYHMYEDWTEETINQYGHLVKVSRNERIPRGLGMTHFAKRIWQSNP